MAQQTYFEIKSYPLCWLCGEPIYQVEYQEMGVCRDCDEERIRIAEHNAAAEQGSMAYDH